MQDSQHYTESITGYKRLKTLPVRIGDLWLGDGHPIRVQTMTTTDTMDTIATVEQSIRCIEAGAELVRITAPSKKEAENLLNIKNELRKRGYNTPIVADIHFTPNAAEIAARIVEKVRVNPGNYVDKKKFEQIEMRIGTNHGSLSDRIMSRYGDTAIGMVESAMEFLRIARAEDFHNIVLSMKSSNPQVMVQAYRLLVSTMNEEFGVCYPLHLGVTEAGDGEDGRIKSAIGIGTLLEDGIGDTIRVSLTEDPEFEIPVCRDIVKRYNDRNEISKTEVPSIQTLPYSPVEYKRRNSFAVDRVGGKQVPVVIADLSRTDLSSPESLRSIGYTYDAVTDKWSIADAAADYVFVGNKQLTFALPGTLKIIAYPDACKQANDVTHYTPIFDAAGFLQSDQRHPHLNWVMIDCFSDDTQINDYTHLDELANDPTVVLCLSSRRKNAMQAVRRMFMELMKRGIENPVVLLTDSSAQTPDDHLIHFATETGALLLDGLGDGICLGYTSTAGIDQTQVKGRTYLPVKDMDQFTNNTACIVNGPGEMADADFGYVGSGPGKITLYKGKEVVKKNVNSDIAVEELINLLKAEGAWQEKEV